MTIRSLRIASTLLCALPLILAACGDSETPKTATPDPSQGAPPSAANAPARTPAAAPATAPKTPSGPEFAEIDWKLVAIEPSRGDAITPDSAATPTLRFNAEPGADGVLRVVGFSGCNQFIGNYSTDSHGSLSMPAPIAMTKVACPDPIKEVENALMMSLGSAASYSIDADELTIRGEGGSLRFSRG